MSKPGPTQEEYDSLLYKLATLESELGQAKKMLEAPAKKVSWWKRYWAGVAVVALVVVMVSVLGAAEQRTLYDVKPIQRTALVGLKGVYVLVESPKPEAQSLGLTKDQIKTDIELRLRKAGIRMLTEKEWLGSPDYPHLSVTVAAITRAGSYSYMLQLYLSESVTLARGNSVMGVIWQTYRIGIGNEQNTETKTQEQVGDMVDDFINDYLAANPKK